MSNTALQKANECRVPAKAAEPVAAATYTPRVDILEVGDELILFADLPGVRPEDVDIRSERGELIVHGKCPPRPSPGNSLYSEYGVGDFYRTFTLSEQLDVNRISARLQNGVLEVHMPKLESVKPKKIAVQGE